MMKPRRIKHSRSYSESSINYFSGDFKPIPNGPNVNPPPQQRNFLNNNSGQPRKFVPPQPPQMNPPNKGRGPPIPPGTYSVLQIRKFLNDTIVEQQRLHQQFIQKNSELEKKQKYLVNLLLRHSQNHASQKIKQLQNYNSLLQQQEAQREMFMRNMVKILNTHGNGNGSPQQNQNPPKLNVNMPLHQQLLNQQLYQNLNQRNPNQNSGRPPVGQKPPFRMGQNRPPQGFNRVNPRDSSGGNRMVPPPPTTIKGTGNKNNFGNPQLKITPNFNTMNLQLPGSGRIRPNINGDNTDMIITPPTGGDPSQDDFFGSGLGGLGDDDMDGGILESPEEIKKPTRPFSPDPMDFEEGIGSFDETSFTNFANPDDDDLPLNDLDLPDLSLTGSNSNPPLGDGFGDDNAFEDDGGQFPMAWNNSLTPMSPPTPDRKVKRIKHESKHRRTQSFNENFLSQHY